MCYWEKLVCYGTNHYIKNGVSIYIFSGFTTLSASELAHVGLWWMTQQIPSLAACTASLYLLSESSVLDLKYLDLTDNSAHICFSLERQMPFTPLVVPPTTCYPSALQESHINCTQFFDLKFSLICVTLELCCEMTKLNQKIWFIQLGVFQMKPSWFNELFCICDNNRTVWSGWKNTLTSLFQPQLPVSHNDLFASSSADQIQIESQNNSGCKGLHNFSGIFNLSKLQSLTRLQRSRSRRKGNF